MKQIGVGLAISALFVTGVLAASAESPDLEIFRPGVVNSRNRPLSARQLSVLLEGLRRWTGFQKLEFDKDGVLRTGDRVRILDGSASARGLLTAAIDGADSFLLENHEGSSEVAFAAIGGAAVYLDGKKVTHDIWSVKFDFRDFARLRGSGESLTAFDPAINLLHELAHGVLRVQDAVDPSDQLGDCERHINQMRREVGLPERRSYEPDKQLAVTPLCGQQRLIGELVFVKPLPGKRTGKTSLLFDVEDVIQREGLVGTR